MKIVAAATMAMFWLSNDDTSSYDIEDAAQAEPCALREKISTTCAISEIIKMQKYSTMSWTNPQDKG